MSREHFNLAAAGTLPGHRLQLHYADDFSATVDLQDWIKHMPDLGPLEDQTLFDQAQFGATYVEWPDLDIELGADNLRNLAVEQSGGIGHERLIEWAYKHDLTNQAAADAIGVSRRMWIYYTQGQKEIPKTVWLACLGWEFEHMTTRSQAAMNHAEGVVALNESLLSFIRSVSNFQSDQAIYEVQPKRIQELTNRLFSLADSLHIDDDVFANAKKRVETSLGKALIQKGPHKKSGSPEAPARG